MTEITLTSAWGGHPAGAVLQILKDGENPRLEAVDSARAKQLVADRIGVNGRPETLPPPPVRKHRKPPLDEADNNG